MKDNCIQNVTLLEIEGSRNMILKDINRFTKMNRASANEVFIRLLTKNNKPKYVIK